MAFFLQSKKTSIFCDKSFKNIPYIIEIADEIHVPFVSVSSIVFFFYEKTLVSSAQGQVTIAKKNEQKMSYVVYEITNSDMSKNICKDLPNGVYLIEYIKKFIYRQFIY